MANFGYYDDIFELGNYFGDFADDYDIDAIQAEYKAAVNNALPDGWHLEGTQLVGPYGGDIPDVHAIAVRIDFLAITDKHEKGKK